MSRRTGASSRLLVSQPAVADTVGGGRLEGPPIATQRVVVPGTETYVEIRSSEVRATWFGYIIETGYGEHEYPSIWGRDNIRDASICFAEAISYAAAHHIAK